MTFTPRRLALSFSLAILLCLSPTHVAVASSDAETEGLDVFAEALSQIRQKYVDEVDEDALIEAAIEGMVRSLDQHSRYFEPNRLDSVRARLSGQYGGIGLRVTEEKGRIKVVTPWEGMPAFRAGIRAGDIITHLDGAPLRDVELSEAVKRLRGPSGTQVAMTIHRDGVEEPFHVTLTREIINLRSVRYRTEGQIGYIRITRFDRQTQRGLEKAITAIKAELGDRLLGYVLDLRGNPGGLVSQAVSVSDSFLNEGRILTTRGRHPSKNREYKATEGDLSDGLPIVVLINGRSASASEIVAGALRDHHRAVLLGSRSYGKGTVQSTISLENDGAIRITTARYYTPSGHSIHEVGIEPDITVEQPETAAADTEETGDEADPDARAADIQLSRAIELLCGLAAVQALDGAAGGDGDDPGHDARRGDRAFHDLPASAMAGDHRPGPVIAGQASSPAKKKGIEATCPARTPMVTAVHPGGV